MTERPERSVQGYRRFRWREYGKQFNERTGSVLNQVHCPSVQFHQGREHDPADRQVQPHADRIRGNQDGRFAFAELPATPQTVVAFVRAMAAEKKPATIRRHLASIAHKHRAAQAPDPCKENAVKLALKTLHRAEGRAQKQVAPLRREHVVAALRARSRLSLRDLRQRAIVAVAYDTLCRASELVALRVRDITPADDAAATVLVRRAKNDQEGEGSVRYSAPTR